MKTNLMNKAESRKQKAEIEVTARSAHSVFQLSAFLISAFQFLLSTFCFPFSSPAQVVNTNAVYVISNPPPAVTFSWAASPSPGVAGYKVWWGAQPRAATGGYSSVLDAGNAVSASVSNLAFGATYYFAATAYASNGLQSAWSNEITNTMPSPPAAPASFTLLTVLAAASPSGPWGPAGSVPAYVALTNQAQFFKLAVARLH
jgi:hypothetical protein